MPLCFGRVAEGRAARSRGQGGHHAGRTRAVTLVDLIVVIAIIALVAAMLFPVFAAARESARQATCISDAKQGAAAILQ